MSFCARLDRADQMAALLECLLMQNSDDAVHVVVDAANVEFHVLGRSKTTRARLTFPSGCFQAYEARDQAQNEMAHRNLLCWFSVGARACCTKRSACCIQTSTPSTEVPASS